MNKMLSLIKAGMTQDMEIIKTVSKKKSKVAFPAFVVIYIMFAMGLLAYSIAEELAEHGITYFLITIICLICILLIFMEGIYKSQGILFSAKDDNLLLSLPISKEQIIALRMIKYYIFLFVFNLLFFVPGLVVYALVEKTNLLFYILSLLLMIFVPIIPMVISSVLGYLVKVVVGNGKNKAVFQTLVTFIFLFGFYYLMIVSNSLFMFVVKNATSINDLLKMIYYPVGAYIALIQEFNIGTFLLWILVNIVPFILFILIGSKFYFKILSDSKNIETVTKKTETKGVVTYKKNSKLKTLVTKEFKRYTSSSIAMTNSALGLIVFIFLSVALCFVNFDMIMKFMEIEMDLGVNPMNVVFLFASTFSFVMTSVTCCLISLEGKTINITKSTPVSYKTVLDSKILLAFVIECPFMIVGDLLFLISNRPSIIFMLLIIIFQLVVIAFNGVVGLIFNLKYPKLNASNDAEMIKQGVAPLLTSLFDLGLFFLIIFLVFLLIDVVSINILVLIIDGVLLMITGILYFILCKNGVKDYSKLSV